MTKTYEVSTENFPNPERGLVDKFGTVFANDGTIAAARRAGQSAVFLLEPLDSYVNRDQLDSLVSARLDGILGRLRGSGFKAIIRFAYNRSAPFNDVPTARLVGHTAQLKTMLASHWDVIYVLQAGFIGPFGNWTGSTNDLLSPANKNEVVNAILDMVPPSRMVQMPFYVERRERAPSPLTEMTAFMPGNPAARIGLFNGCLLGDDTDGGFFPLAGTADARKAVQNDGRYVVVGGQLKACGDLSAPRFSCSRAVGLLAEQRLAYIDVSELPKPIQDQWAKEGCWDEIVRRVGYRFHIAELTHTPRVRPGGRVAITFTIKNTGFSSLHNERPLFLVFEDTSRPPNDPKRIEAVQLAIDPRRWGPDSTSTHAVKIQLPGGWAAGKRKVHLWLPDNTPMLRQPMGGYAAPYSVRLAHKAGCASAGSTSPCWDGSSGYNLLTDDLQIAADAPAAAGDVDTANTALRQIP